MSKEAMKSEMVDDEGENQAVRMFLAMYGGQYGITIKQMFSHLKMAGFDGAWPEWANSEMHLTKAGAQLWIRHLFALAEPAPVQQETVETVKQWRLAGDRRWENGDPQVDFPRHPIERRTLYTSPPAQRKPFGYAGITIWGGDATVTKVFTETQMEFAREPRSLIEAVVGQCLDELAAHNIKENT